MVTGLHITFAFEVYNFTRDEEEGILLAKAKHLKAKKVPKHTVLTQLERRGKL